MRYKSTKLRSVLVDQRLSELSTKPMPGPSVPDHRTINISMSPTRFRKTDRPPSSLQERSSQLTLGPHDNRSPRLTRQILTPSDLTPIQAARLDLRVQLTKEPSKFKEQNSRAGSHTPPLLARSQCTSTGFSAGSFVSCISIVYMQRIWWKLIEYFSFQR